jgi:hypothetical protein
MPCLGWRLLRALGASARGNAAIDLPDYLSPFDLTRRAARDAGES